MNEIQCEMPRYKCHKQVWALKIKTIELDSDKAKGRETDGSAVITPEEAGYAPFRVERDYVFKHKPETGGYYVVYADGYKSFSPAKAFEEGYSPASKSSDKPCYVLGRATIEAVAEKSELQTERVDFIAASDLYHNNPFKRIENPMAWMRSWLDAYDQSNPGKPATGKEILEWINQQPACSS